MLLFCFADEIVREVAFNFADVWSRLVSAVRAAAYGRLRQALRMLTFSCGMPIFKIIF